MYNILVNRSIDNIGGLFGDTLQLWHCQGQSVYAATRWSLAIHDFRRRFLSPRYCASSLPRHLSRCLHVSVQLDETRKKK